MRNLTQIVFLRGNLSVVFQEIVKNFINTVKTRKQVILTASR